MDVRVGSALLLGLVLAMGLVVLPRGSRACTNALTQLVETGTVPADLIEELEVLALSLSTFRQSLDNDVFRSPRTLVSFRRAFEDFVARHPHAPDSLAPKDDWTALCVEVRAVLAQQATRLDAGDVDGALILVNRLDRALERLVEPPHRWVTVVDWVTTPVDPTTLAALAVLLPPLIRRDMLEAPYPPWKDFVGDSRGAVGLPRVPAGSGVTRPSLESFSAELARRIGESGDGSSGWGWKLSSVAGETFADSLEEPLTPAARSALQRAGAHWYLAVEILDGMVSRRESRDELDVTGGTVRIESVGRCEVRWHAFLVRDNTTVSVAVRPLAFQLRELHRRTTEGLDRVASSSVKEVDPAACWCTDGRVVLEGDTTGLPRCPTCSCPPRQAR